MRVRWWYMPTHDLAPELPIIARATSEQGTKYLAQLGAQDVIHPELEGGLEIIRHILLQLGSHYQRFFATQRPFAMIIMICTSILKKSADSYMISSMLPTASRYTGFTSLKEIHSLDKHLQKQICGRAPGHRW